MATTEKKKGRYLNFKGMAHLNLDVHLETIGQEDPQVLPLKKDGLLAEIFAPDPVTGMPRSDLHIQLSGSFDPKIQEYIRRTLQQPLPSDVGSLDPDVVIANARKFNETIDDYVGRLAKSIESLKASKSVEK